MMNSRECLLHAGIMAFSRWVTDRGLWWYDPNCLPSASQSLAGGEQNSCLLLCCVFCSFYEWFNDTLPQISEMLHGGDQWSQNGMFHIQSKAPLSQNLWLCTVRTWFVRAYGPQKQSPVRTQLKERNPAGLVHFKACSAGLHSGVLWKWFPSPRFDMVGELFRGRCTVTTVLFFSLSIWCLPILFFSLQVWMKSNSPWMNALTKADKNTKVLRWLGVAELK